MTIRRFLYAPAISYVILDESWAAVSTDSATRSCAAGVIGLETTGVADRSIAMDILH
jgi:hypothetical protein